MMDVDVEVVTPTSPADVSAAFKYTQRAAEHLARDIERSDLSTYNSASSTARDLAIAGRRCHFDCSNVLKELATLPPSIDENVLLSISNSELARNILVRNGDRLFDGMCSITAGKDLPTETLFIIWSNVMESLFLLSGAIRIFLVDAGPSFLKEGAYASSTILREIESLCVTAQVSPKRTVLVSASKLKNHIAALLSMALTNDDVVYRGMMKLTQAVKESSRQLRSYRDSLAPPNEECDSSSSDEPLMGASGVPGNDLITLSAARMICKVSTAVLEDISCFITDQFDLNQNLCWGCYGVAWLEAVLKVSKRVAVSTQALAKLVAPPHDKVAILNQLRFLRVHTKALIDLANGHDQFQESRIPSNKEIFKTGHHWQHRMNRHLATACNALLEQLYTK